MIANDMTALSLVITSLATLIGVVVNAFSSFRNSRKIDATHDIAVQTFNATGAVRIATRKPLKDLDSAYSDTDTRDS